MATESPESKRKYEFCLGGRDEEMKEIKKVSLAAGHVVHDNGLGWGAKASSYEDAFAEPPKACGEYGLCDPHKHYEYQLGHHKQWASTTFVLVELEVDCELPDNCIVIDHHHAKAAGRQPALQQVLALLQVEATKEQDMIGAMDAGYIFGLIAMGFSSFEIADFLGQSRELSIRDMLIAACTLTADEDAEAERDIAAANHYEDGLIIVRRDRNTCAEVCAKLFGKQARQNILILSDWTDGQTGKHKQEANFYSTGERVRVVAAKFPQGWTGGGGLNPQTPDGEEFWGKYGGQAPDTAFFGVTGDYLQVERFIRDLD